MPNRGDVVLYSQNGRTYNALVLLANEANNQRTGEKGEPSLHLAVLLDDPKPLPLGQVPAVTVIYDVVHASHEFDAAYLNHYGSDAVSHRGLGEWTEGGLKEKLSDLLTGTVPALYGTPEPTKPEPKKEAKRWGKTKP